MFLSIEKTSGILRMKNRKEKKMKIKLEQAFELARQFFPRWDKGRRWRIKVDINKPNRYDSQSKTIWLNRWLEDDPNLMISTIIHEICHRYASYHGKRFQALLKQVSVQARNKNMDDLADWIDRNIESCISVTKLGKHPSKKIESELKRRILKITQSI
jgi:hypothetical protein